MSWFKEFKGIVPSRKNGTKNKRRFDEFLASGFKAVVIDWQEMGYKDKQTAYNVLIKAAYNFYPENIRVSTNDGVIYFERKDI